jgi:hypothetical protein
MGLGTVGVFLNNKNILFFILAWMDISSRLIFPLPTRKDFSPYCDLIYDIYKTKGSFFDEEEKFRET